MRIFKTKGVVRFARREKIADASLSEAVFRAEQGLIDAELGGGLIKQRVARTGKGRSGGYRLLIAIRAADRAIFLFGFAKSERDNISSSELDTLRETAAEWLAASPAMLEQALKRGLLVEVRYEN